MMNLNLFLLSVTVMVSAAGGTSTVDLGSASDFVILAKSGITNVVGSAITGDIGVSPIAAGAMTGFGLVMDSSNEFSTSSEVIGKAKAPDYTTPTGPELTAAVNNMETAYNDAAARATDVSNLKEGAIGGETLGPGVYTFDTDVTISGDITFNGTSEDVFIIQTSKSIIQATSTQVLLTGGALAENIFWSVAQQVIVGADSHLEGIILANTAVRFSTGSSLKGRIFSQTAVTLQKAVITQP
jgi:cytoskeletal protein CcmA (bactofilin family)